VIGRSERHCIGDVLWHSHAAPRDVVDEILTKFKARITARYRGWPRNFRADAEPLKFAGSLLYKVPICPCLPAAWLCMPVELVGLEAGDAAEAFALHPWRDSYHESDFAYN
jgi:hypothetical protein